MKTVAFLEAVEDITGGNSKVPRSEYRQSGQLPVVDQGKGLVSGYTDNTSHAFRHAGPKIIFGDHTRAMKYVDFPFAMGADGVKVLRTRGDFHPKFVYHYLRTVALPDAGYSRHFKFLKEIQVPRPPLEEQRRIAAILDHADSLRVKRRHVVSQLNDLAQSIFFDMFGDPDFYLGTDESVRFCEVADLKGGRNLVADDENSASKYRVLKISAVTSGQFKAVESKPLPPDYQPPSEHMVRSGDLLISRANTAELVGAVAYVDVAPSDIALPDKIWRFVWKNPDSNPLYYWSLFRTPSVRRRVSQLSSGTGGSMKNISKTKLEQLELPNVPVKRQFEFARRVAAVPRVTTDDLDELFASLQARAFRGEL
ncbi:MULTISPECIES: restriction endonuclease subunit S [unclassified Mycobacterium]|uniref:restriction endonuclease subunit S n=1 Tax=Mycobacterium sp. DL99 TaxID=2528957 RepID=UPI0010815719|nr:restriction endonuclease subunit S [Mycobacterium sp. DL99]